MVKRGSSGDSATIDAQPMFSFDDLYSSALDGKYRILRGLGRGGMGAVFAAEHLGTGRMVAVKIILPQLLRHPEALERFRREARAAGGLRHPNIVDVTDFGVARVGNNQIAYLVMEYLEGTTLHSFIESNGKLKPALVAAIVEQIALALEAAHAAGMVHRDLKPDNVWLIPDPRGGYIVRVLDFGIAKLRESPERSVERGELPLIAGDAPTFETPAYSEELTAARVDDTGARTAVLAPPLTPVAVREPSQPLTVSGSTLGTPAYMSPEQCRGEDVDLRSDIYSLGVLTYEALSGKPPFSGTFRELLDAHQNRAPEPLERAAGISKEVARVVSRALAKPAAERYPSASAMAGSLNAAVESPAVILQRSVALSADRFPLFAAIVLRAFAGVVGPLAVVLAALAFFLSGGGLIVVFGILISWMLLTSLTNAAFALTIDLLRVRPLVAPAAAEIFSNLKERLGVGPAVGLLRLSMIVAYRYARAEMTAVAGAGDLAFLISLLEQLPAGEVPKRCEILARAASKSYSWIRAMIFASMMLPPVIEGLVAYAILTLSGVRPAGTLAFGIAIAMIPLNAVVLNPISGSALGLLYFRARQANGEHVMLSSRMTGGV